uniref:Uncharacterized protein n=1 Tax=Caenorhabditis japonica TaxID=281687 RepID=A0A8R1HKC4_CAEJA
MSTSEDEDFEKYYKKSRTKKIDENQKPIRARKIHRKYIDDCSDVFEKQKRKKPLFQPEKTEWFRVATGECSGGLQPARGDNQFDVEDNVGIDEVLEKTSFRLLNPENPVSVKIKKTTLIALGAKIASADPDVIDSVAKQSAQITNDVIYHELRQAVQKTKGTPECLIWMSQLGLACTFMERDNQKQVEIRKVERALESARAEITNLRDAGTSCNSRKERNRIAFLNPALYDGPDVFVSPLYDNGSNEYINVNNFYTNFGTLTGTLSSIIIQCTIRWVDHVRNNLLYRITTYSSLGYPQVTPPQLLHFIQSIKKDKISGRTNRSAF